MVKALIRFEPVTVKVFLLRYERTFCWVNVFAVMEASEAHQLMMMTQRSFDKTRGWKSRGVAPWEMDPWSHVEAELQKYGNSAD